MRSLSRPSIAHPGNVTPGRALTLAFSLLVLSLANPATVAAQQGSDDVLAALLDGLDARHIGPVGNRVAAVVGIPGEPNVYLAGAASGGIWKTTDGGHGWRPVFDDFEVQSIGALAVAPSNPDVIYAGTGEPWIRSNVSHGMGVFRSDDEGETWRFVGLPESGRIGRIVVHPEDEDVAWVAALGNLYEDQEERGVFRTRDGGETWERVLHTDPGTGAFGLWMKADDPNTIFASLWTMHIRTWGRWSGGPNGGIYRSEDGGDSWTKLEGNGLPNGDLGKIDLTGSPDDPDRVYALIETNANSANGPLNPGGEDEYQYQGVLWRSDDAGESWAMVQAEHRIQQRPHYYTRLVAAPDDADQVHFMATGYSITDDGGPTLRGGGGNGGDFHDMWIDPTMPDRMILGHDQGVSISTTRGRAWYRPLLPIAQMYHAQVDNKIPYNVYGNRQDGPSTAGPSRVLYGGQIPVGEWKSVGGCESGWAVPDTVNEVVWSGCYEGILDRHDLATRTSRRVTVWPDNPEALAAEEVRYRFQWTFPITLSPFDPSVVYVGSQHVHRSTNGGQSWEVISPDLSTGTDSLLKKTGGLTPDDAGPTYAAVVFAIAESPLVPGELWAGTNDGKLWVRRDVSAEWTDLTENLPDLPVFSTISSIEVSRHAAGKAYVAVDGHQIGVFEPMLYVTEDFGASFRRIDGNIPRSVLSFTHVLQEDPERPGLLYAGTGNGLFVSQTDGLLWTRYEGIPAAPVHWVEVQDHFDDLVIATYGRGFYIVDDINPLQDPPETVMAQTGGASGDWTGTGLVNPTEPHLFAPRDWWRFDSEASPFSQPGVPAAGSSGPSGALINYWLPEGVEEVSLEIVDEAGEIISRVRASSAPGFNRTQWGLRHFSSNRPTMRTPAVEQALAGGLGPDGTRSAGDGGTVSPTAIPGTYTVRLAVDGEVLEQPLTILPDPNTTGSMEGMRAQLEMSLELRDMADRVVAVIDALEVERARLLDMEEANGGLSAADRARYDALTELEMQLTDLRLTGGQDSLWWGRRLYAKITSLGGYISGTDFGPTDQAREVQMLYEELLRAAEAELARLRIIAEDGAAGAPVA
jgi:photosystem II stability/assembly factor-like uncharacterized protein